MFIVFDGIDGAGKGRQREEILSYLLKNKIEVEGEEFPVHNSFYENVIHPALQEEVKMNSSSWLLSYLLDKTLESDRISPFVNDKSKHFIADGYFTTTIAYQCYLMKQVSLKKLLSYARDFQIPTPDFSIYIDVDPKIAYQRKEIEEGHDEGLDMFEKSIDKQVKLREIFNNMVEKNIYCEWVKVDGNNSVEQVMNDILVVLKEKNLL